MDAGTEFVLVRKWCADNNIKTYLHYSNKTKNYMDSLGSNLEGYNNSTYFSIGLPPNIAWSDKSTHPQIREKLQVYNNKFIKIKPRFKIGDIVRIKLLPKSYF